MRHELDKAIAHYHSLIAKDLIFAEGQLQQLREQQQQRKVTFGGRALSHSLRPAFLSERMYTEVQDTVYILRQATLKLAAAYFNQPEAMDELGLTAEEIELASIPTNVIRLSATARLDAFMTADSFKFVEFNAESPAGPAYVNELAKIYRELELFRRFEKKYPIRFVSPLEHLVAGLLRTYHEEFDGREERPTFCVVDLPDVPTYNEFLLFKEYMNRFGYECVVSDPRALECHNGWIYADGKKIDILYRRFLLNEFLEVRADCKAYLDGYIAQKTCYLNSFRAKLVHKKAVFAFLTDERYNHILSQRELDAIEQHIPWTRRIKDQKTRFRGLTIDLLEFIRANRRYFVIKPNDEYGGKGVVLGFAASQSEWESGIDQGLRDGFVVQEVVDIHKEPFFMQVDGTWRDVPIVVDLDPYLNGPLMGGCLTRISASNLANVTAGGGTIPLFILRYIR